MLNTRIKTWQKVCIAICGIGFVFSVLLFIPFVQNLILDFGENVVVHRPLTRPVWIGRFVKWGWYGCSLVFLLLVLTFFSCTDNEKIRKIIPESEKLSWAIIISITIATIIFGTMVLQNGHNWGGDFSEYIADARNLATGTYPENQPKLGYLYGTAIILLPFYLIFGLNPLALKIPMVISYAGTVFFVGLFFKKRFSGFKLFLSVSIFAFNPYMIDFLNNILSDIPFLFLSMVSIYYIEKIYDDKNTAKEQCLSAIIAGVCTTLAKMCREEGLVLILAFLSSEIIIFINKFSKNSFIKQAKISLNSKGVLPHVIFYITMCLTFFLLHFFVAVGFNHKNNFDSVRNISPKTIVFGIKYYSCIFKDFLYGNIFLWFLCAPLILIGIIKKLTDKIFIVIYVAGFLCLHILTTFIQGLRYVFPTLPFLIMFAFYGFDYLNEIFKEKYFIFFRKFYILFAVFLCIFSFWSSFSMGIGNLIAKREWNYGAFSTQAKEVYDYIIKNTTKEDNFLFVKPRVLFLNTLRGTKNPVRNDVGASKDADIFNEQLNLNDYFLLSMDFDETLDDYKIPADKKLDLVFKNDRFELYKIIK